MVIYIFKLIVVCNRLFSLKEYGRRSVLIAALYIRVSTADQAEKGYSLETQLLEIRQKAVEFGATDFVEFIDDGYSGEYINRPALTELRDGLDKKSFDMVVIYDPDRLARNLAHQLIITEEIEKSGAKLLFVSVSFEASHEGKLFYSMRGAIAAYEKEKIKERTMRGKKGKARQGKLVNNGHCYGYNYDKEHCMYIINEQQAAIVRQIFALCINDKLGTVLICEKLNQEGIPAPRGKQWIASSIHRILTNSAYRGVVQSMKHKSIKTGFKTRRRETRPESDWIPIEVPAIVDDNTWHCAQTQLQKNKIFAKKNIKYDHLLNGLVYCGHCGKKMTIKHSGNSTNIVSYYACLSQTSTSYRYLKQKKCAARRVPTAILDKVVWDKVYELVKNSELITKYIQDNSSPIAREKFKNALMRITAIEKKIRMQKETIMGWFSQQLIDDMEAEKQLNEMNKQLAAIAISKKNLYAQLESSSPPINLEDIGSLYNEEEQKAAIRTVLEKAIVKRIDTTRGRSSKPEMTIDLIFL